MVTNETCLPCTEVCACRFAMMAIANLQRVWTLFIKPLTVGLHAIQVAFAVLIPSQLQVVTVESYIPDRLRPRVVGECRSALPRYVTESAWIH
jgi:hypothetical protein